MVKGGGRSWIGSAAPAALLFATLAACVSTTSQFPPGSDGGGGGGGPATDGGPQGACDPGATWQVTFGSATGGSTITFSVPSADTNGGSWTPTTGFTYTFDAKTCTVSLATGGCPGVGTFDLETRSCNMLTQATCDAATCPTTACPTQPTTCLLGGL
jgi:hypothetical protein